MRNLIGMTLGLLLAMVQLGFGQDPCCGKIDVGPAYAHIDILESGHTVKTMNMMAFKGDANFLFWPGTGFILKPMVIYGFGGGEIFSGGAGIGHCIPLDDCWVVTPIVGCNYTSMHTHINIPFLGLRHLKERFRSVSPYVALEIVYKITPCWRICAVYQYSWSRTRTTIRGLVNDKSHTQGPTYSALIEYDINKCWSVNLGAMYNISLTKERHGLRGAGVKAGVARWF